MNEIGRSNDAKLQDVLSALEMINNELISISKRNSERTFCAHSKVPFVKSYYSDEMVKRGYCTDCDVHILELD